MPNQNLTEIVALLDRSGSMSSVQADMEGGFNSFIEEQKKGAGEVRLTLVQFDEHHNKNVIETLYTAARLDTVAPLRFRPRGNTPLLEALGQTIASTGARFAAMPESERPGKVLFIVITDGQNNRFGSYTAAQVRQMVEHQTQVYKWEFVFLGANIDSFTVAQSYGISVLNSSNYVPDSAGVRNLFAAVGSSAKRYRSGGSVAFSEAERSVLTKKE